MVLVATAALAMLAAVLTATFLLAVNGTPSLVIAAILIKLLPRLLLLQIHVDRILVLAQTADISP